MNFGINLLIDGGLLATLLTINSIEDLNGIVKLSTSFLVGIIAIIRLYFLLKGNNDKENSKNT